MQMQNSLKITHGVKEAATCIGVGILHQEKGDYSKAKVKMQEGIEKIKQVLLKDNANDKEMIFEYYSVFEKCLLNVNNQEENERLSLEMSSGNTNEPPEKLNTNDSIREIQSQYMLQKSHDENDLFAFTMKMMQKLGDSIENGIYISKNMYIRREIWVQLNAKIECLHQKYEIMKVLNEKIENLMILSRSNVINLENIDKFCDLLNDIQNNLNKELDFIKPSSFNLKNDANPAGFYKKFSEISSKIKTNLLSIKLQSVPDYYETFLKLVKKYKDLEIILNSKCFKKEDLEQIKERRTQISIFFYNTAVKWTLQELKDLTLRFLKKKILSFESK